MQLQIQSIVDSAWKACLRVVETTQAMLAGARKAGRSRTTQGRRGALASRYVVATVIFCLVRRKTSKQQHKKQKTKSAQAGARAVGRLIARGARQTQGCRGAFLSWSTAAIVCLCLCRVGSRKQPVMYRNASPG